MPNVLADQYLYGILAREAVDVSFGSPVRSVQTTLAPILRQWAGSLLLSVVPSGSFAKGTANKSGTDIDLFISLSETTSQTLREIYSSLQSSMRAAGYVPRPQNVSLRVRVGSHNVDLVPAKRQGPYTTDHSLYRRKADSWTKTNVATHISTVVGSGRTNECRILKLWRDQNGLEFPSFYLELSVIAALSGHGSSLSDNVWYFFTYLKDAFSNARVVDPANTANIVSDDLTIAEKIAIKAAAAKTLAAASWGNIVA